MHPDPVSQSLAACPVLPDGLRLRPLAPADLPGLMAVQRACYGDGFIEDEAVFARRLASAAHCSLALVRAQEPQPQPGQEGAAPEQVAAYLAAYRSRLGRVTPLQGGFHGAPGADALYLHDMAVSPAWAGADWPRPCCQSPGSAPGTRGCAIRRWCRCRARRASGNARAMQCRPWRTRTSSGIWTATARGRSIWCAWRAADSPVLGAANKVLLASLPHLV